jgi:cytochrome c oxidase cbb3-type subunit III
MSFGCDGIRQVLQKAILSALLCTLSLAAEVRRNPFGLAEEAVTEGRALYNRSCTMCHGLDGQVGDRAPALAGDRRFLRRSDADLFDAIQKGIEGTLMPAMRLPDADAWKIVSYIRSLRATAIDAPPDGNVEAGRAIFFGRGGCSGCHMIEGRGGILGPELSNLGAQRTVQAILEALTQPRQHIPRGYQPVKLSTREGRSIEGIVRNENNFSLQVLGRDGRLHLLERREVARIDYASQSLMPTDFDQRLGEEGLRDLVAYLSRLAASRARLALAGEEH